MYLEGNQNYTILHGVAVAKKMYSGELGCGKQATLVPTRVMGINKGFREKTSECENGAVFFMSF